MASKTVKAHWQMVDPVVYEGKHSERVQVYRTVMDFLRSRIVGFIELYEDSKWRTAPLQDKEGTLAALHKRLLWDEFLALHETKQTWKSKRVYNWLLEHQKTILDTVYKKHQPAENDILINSTPVTERLEPLPRTTEVGIALGKLGGLEAVLYLHEKQEATLEDMVKAFAEVKLPVVALPELLSSLHSIRLIETRYDQRYSLTNEGIAVVEKLLKHLVPPEVE